MRWRTVLLQSLFKHLEARTLSRCLELVDGPGVDRATARISRPKPSRHLLSTRICKADSSSRRHFDAALAPASLTLRGPQPD